MCSWPKQHNTHTDTQSEWMSGCVSEWARGRERESEWGSNTHWTRFHYNSFDSLGALDAAKMSYLSGTARLGASPRPLGRLARYTQCVCVGVCMRMFRANAKLSEMKLTTFRFCIKAKRSRSRFPTPSPSTPFRLLSSTPFPSLAPLWLFTCSVQWPSLSCCCWIYSGSGPMHC